jgi:hypothetical protein
MDRIEDPSDAAQVLASALRLQALPAEDQILLFAPHCVACGVRTAFDQWEREFAESHFVGELTRPQQSSLDRVRQANAECAKSVECHSSRYVCESPAMAAMRQAAAAALAAFGWPAGPPDREYLYGTHECAERLKRLLARRKQEQLESRRMEPAEPRFHAATFAILGHPHLVNRTRLAEIECWEARYGLQLPGAVREWYAMEGPDLWERVRPRDYVPPLDKLEPLQPALVRGKGDDETFFALWGPSDERLEVVEAKEPFPYLLVCADTDVGIPCVVRVDGSDDPPVFVMPEGADNLELAWQRYTEFQSAELSSEWP